MYVCVFNTCKCDILDKFFIFKDKNIAMLKKANLNKIQF